MATSVTVDPSSGPLISGQYKEITVVATGADPNESLEVTVKGFWFFDDADYVDSTAEGTPKTFPIGDATVTAGTATWVVRLVVKGRDDTTPTIEVAAGAATASGSYTISDYVVVVPETFEPSAMDDENTVVLKPVDPNNDPPSDTDTNHAEVTFAGHLSKTDALPGVALVARVYLKGGEDIDSIRIYGTSSDTSPEEVIRPFDIHKPPYVVLKSDEQGKFSFLVYPTADAIVADVNVELSGQRSQLGTVLVPILKNPDPNINAPEVIGTSGGVYHVNTDNQYVAIAVDQGYGASALAANDMLYLFVNNNYPPKENAWTYTGVAWSVVLKNLDTHAAVMSMPAAYLALRNDADSTAANALAFLVHRPNDEEMRTSSTTLLIARNPVLGNHPPPPSGPALPPPDIKEYRGGQVINADDVKNGLTVLISLEDYDLAEGGVTSAPTTADTIEVTVYLNGFEAGTDNPKSGIPPVTRTITQQEIDNKQAVFTFDRSDIEGYGAAISSGAVGTLEAAYVYTPASGSPVRSDRFGPVRFASRTMGTAFKKHS